MNVFLTQHERGKGAPRWRSRRPPLRDCSRPRTRRPALETFLSQGKKRTPGRGRMRVRESSRERVQKRRRAERVRRYTSTDVQNGPPEKRRPKIRSFDDPRWCVKRGARGSLHPDMWLFIERGAGGATSRTSVSSIVCLDMCVSRALRGSPCTSSGLRTTHGSRLREVRPSRATGSSE